MSTRHGSAAIGVGLGLVIGILAGGGAVLAQGPGASAGAVTPATVRLVGSLTAASAAVRTGSGTAGAAIVYPYLIFGGSPGIAPDHTIVVTGVGQADVASDDSDRTAAGKTARVAALADAKAQATAITAAVGVSIRGVVSVSASVGPSWPPPLAGSASPGQPPSQPTPAPGLPQPAWPAQFNVSVTVVYGIG